MGLYSSAVIGAASSSLSVLLICRIFHFSLSIILLCPPVCLSFHYIKRLFLDNGGLGAITFFLLTINP